MHSDEYWLHRMATALNRAQRYGSSDWTSDIAGLLEEFHDERGLWGECDACPSGDAHHFVKVTEVGHPNPDTLKLCTDHRQPWFPSRTIVDHDVLDDSDVRADLHDAGIDAEPTPSLSCERCGRTTSALCERRMDLTEPVRTRRVCGLCVAETYAVVAAA